ncbi:hypothetical protein IWX49DRAFT_570834, partial [Phyllosticta citricarpa]
MPAPLSSVVCLVLEARLVLRLSAQIFYLRCTAPNQWLQSKGKKGKKDEKRREECERGGRGHPHTFAPVQSLLVDRL